MLERMLKVTSNKDVKVLPTVPSSFHRQRSLSPWPPSQAHGEYCQITVDIH